MGGINNSIQPYMPSLSGVNLSGQSTSTLHSNPAKTINYVSQSTHVSKDEESRPTPQNSSSASEQNSSVNMANKESVTGTQQEASSEEQVQQVINQLKARDTEVRAHEQAHMATAGSYATGMSFVYQTGPDGRQYAVGGEVGIDTSTISGDPEANLQKAIVLQRAALAPAEPSAQDQRVARAASQMMAQARVEMAAQAAESESVAEIEPGESSLFSAPKSAVRENSDVNQITVNDEQDQALNLVEQARQQFNLRMQMPTAENLLI